MKVLHVFERIFHYVKVWCFVAAGVLVAFSLFNTNGLVTFDGVEFAFDAAGVVENLAPEYGGVVLPVETAAPLYAIAQLTQFAALPMLVVVVAIVFWVLEHIFKKVQRIHAHTHHGYEFGFVCEGPCGKCKCEEGSTDVQVEKIMKWKDLYNEGIITEREFIQKRNEILGLHK